MVEELSGNMKKVYDAMVKIGAAGEGKAKEMEDIVRGANSINELIRKKVVEREKRPQNTA